MNKGTKVVYNSMSGAQVLGVVEFKGRDSLGEFVRIKVTSRSIAAYPQGLLYDVPADSPWLSLR